jgi:vacuolar iron transporter family protein
MFATRESYNATLNKTRGMVNTDPIGVSHTISSIFTSYDVPADAVKSLTVHLTASPRVLDFLMRFEHTVSEPAGSRALTCAMTIASGYFIGGFVPLIPYFFVGNNDVYKGLVWSIGIMIVALFSFGYVKTCLNSGWGGWGSLLLGVKGGAQMVVVGSAAAGAAMGIVRAFGSHDGTV